MPASDRRGLVQPAYDYCLNALTPLTCWTPGGRSASPNARVYHPGAGNGPALRPGYLEQRQKLGYPLLKDPEQRRKVLAAAEEKEA
jgi:glycyl-tRNA synthetase alpha chain